MKMIPKQLMQAFSSSFMSSKKTVAEGLNSVRSVMDSRRITTFGNPTRTGGKAPTGKLADQESGAQLVDLAKNVRNSTAIDLVGQIAQTVASNVGSFTRNRANQNKANNLMLAGNKGVGLATAFLMGQGPGVALFLASEALNIASKTYNLTIELEERFAQSTKATERLGRVVSMRGRA
jgi:hypothetical protein